MADNREPKTKGWIQRFNQQPMSVRLVALLVLGGLAVLLSKWLILILLIALGLWPITLLIGLIVLGIYARLDAQRGWPWMKDWLQERLRERGTRG